MSVHASFWITIAFVLSTFVLFLNPVKAQSFLGEYSACIDDNLEASLQELDEVTSFYDVLELTIEACDSSLNRLVLVIASTQSGVDQTELFEVIRRDTRKMILHAYVQFLHEQSK